MKEIGEHMKPLNEYENAIIAFDDFLGSSSSTFTNEFFIKRRHYTLEKLYLSLSCFDLPKKTLGKNSNEVFLFNQTLKDRKNMYRDVGGNDMSYDEFEQECKNSWEEDYKNLCNDRSKIRDQERYCICNENKNTYTECTPETKHFY